MSAVKDKGKDIAQHAAILAPSLVPVAELVSVVGKSKSAYDNYNELKGATTDPAIMKKAIWNSNGWFPEWCISRVNNEGRPEIVRDGGCDQPTG